THPLSTLTPSLHDAVPISVRMSNLPSRILKSLLKRRMMAARCIELLEEKRHGKARILKLVNSRSIFWPSHVASPPTILYILPPRSEEHTSELQSRQHLVCR